MKIAQHKANIQKRKNHDKEETTNQTLNRKKRIIKQKFMAVNELKKKADQLDSLKEATKLKESDEEDATCDKK